MREKNLVSVIIINYNGRSLLPVCLESLSLQNYASLEIILVDNGSSDGSKEFVKGHFPHVKIIENSANLGFAKAANQGIENSKGEFVALLNNDTRVDENWICHLVRAAAKDPKIGSCASKQLNFFDHRIIDSTGIQFFRGGYARDRGRGEIDRGQFDNAREIFGAPGASAFYRRDMLDQIGFFDSDYFAYCEELDLSFRAQLAGWKCAYVPEAVMYHRGGETRARTERGFLIYQTERNRIFTIIKNYPAMLFVYDLPFLLKYEFDAFIRLIKHSEKELLMARLAAFMLMPRMLRKRSPVRSVRKVSVAGLRRLIVRRRAGENPAHGGIAGVMKLKVMMIDMCGWGGIAHYTYNLMQALGASDACEPTLLTDRSYELDGLARDFQIIKCSFRGQPYFLAAFRLLREIIRHRPDVVHVQTGLAVRKDWLLF